MDVTKAPIIANEVLQSESSFVTFAMHGLLAIFGFILVLVVGLFASGYIRAFLLWRADAASLRSRLDPATAATNAHAGRPNYHTT